MCIIGRYCVKSFVGKKNEDEEWILKVWKGGRELPVGLEGLKDTKVL